jgi:hypothetical protein
MASPDKEKWQVAMEEELAALLRNMTWELVKRPGGVKPLKTRWVYKLKLKGDRTIERYKARLVALAHVASGTLPSV